jgi:aminopeptidase
MILFYFNKQAGTRTGDRVWRMPLLKHYTKQVTESQLADVNNIGNIPRSGGACTAAAFLRVNKYFNCLTDFKHVYQ